VLLAHRQRHRAAAYWSFVERLTLRLDGDAEEIFVLAVDEALG
jgi:hypothetical protein